MFESVGLHLPEGQRAEVLGESLAAARAMEEESRRAHMLAALAEEIARLPRTCLHRLWDESLGELAARTRKDLLSDLRALAPVLAALGGELAVAETFRAIQDVGSWWP